MSLKADVVPVVDQPLPGPNAAGAIDLPANLVAIVNAYGANTRLMGSGSTAHVGAWDRVGTALSWEFSGSAGKYRLEAEVAAAGEAGRSYLHENRTTSSRRTIKRLIRNCPDEGQTVCRGQ